MDKNQKSANPAKPGFLFDLDGVLIDSREFHWQSWQELQKEVPDFRTTYDEFVQSFGQRNDQILQEKLPQATPARRKQLAERKEEIFREICGGQLTLLPGMEKFLQDLEKKGYAKIIASSTPTANLTYFLQKTVLGQYFSDYVSGDDVEKGKPHPEVFLKAAQEIHLPANQCVVLEDSHAGLEAGRKSGAFVIALATTHKESELPSQFYNVLYHSPKELNLDEIIKKRATF